MAAFSDAEPPWTDPELQVPGLRREAFGPEETNPVAHSDRTSMVTDDAMARSDFLLASHEDGSGGPSGSDLRVDPLAAVLPELARPWFAAKGSFVLPGIAPAFRHFRRQAATH